MQAGAMGLIDDTAFDYYQLLKLQALFDHIFLGTPVNDMYRFIYKLKTDVKQQQAPFTHSLIAFVTSYVYSILTCKGAL